MSGQSSGAWSGLVSGAAAGSAGGVWGAVIGGFIGFVGGAISGGAADQAQKNQEAWARYNAREQYKSDLYNISSRTKLSRLNASTSLSLMGIENSTISALTQYNVGLIGATTLYNQELQRQELDDLWSGMDLDLSQIETYRARERGGIVAEQAASGTVIGEGSNEDVVISQMAQEALDKAVIMHGADIEAAGIKNSMAQGAWQGIVAIQQSEYRGRLEMYKNTANGLLSANSGLVANSIQSEADTYTALQRMKTGDLNIQQSRNAFNLRNQQQLTASLFSAAGSAVGSYYAGKTPGSSIATGSGFNTVGAGSYAGAGTSLFSGPGGN